MADMTYCISPCPFTDCYRHYSKMREAEKMGQKYVSVADFAPVCKVYISQVLEVIENDARTT